MALGLDSGAAFGGSEHERARAAVAGTGGYEPPRVEQVLTPAGLEREILYAGAPATE